MSRTAGVLALGGVLLGAFVAACTTLLGATDVPTPDEGGTADATLDGTGDARDSGVPSDAPADVAHESEASVEACTPDATRCEGQQPQLCGPTGQWTEAGAPCAFLCEDAGCTGVCVPTTGQCVGLAPEICGPDGQWQEAGTPCTFLCDAGVCAGSCTPNTVQCVTSGGADAGLDAGPPVESIDTCNAAGQLTSVPCTQPTPDCTSSPSGPVCECTGSLCGTTCIHLDTDPSNCGTCGHSCLGGACVASVCQPGVLASKQQSPYDLTIDTTNVYWVDLAGGTVLECAIGGCGNSPTVLASGQHSPTALTVSASTVYWVNDAAQDGGAGGSVMSCPVAGCAGGPTLVTPTPSAPTAVAVSGGSVYWTNPSGTSTCTVASCTPTAFGPGGIDITVDSTRAYWTVPSLGPVRCALGGCGGAPTTIASGQAGAWAITVDSTNVYWTNLTALVVASAPLGGGGPVTTLSSSERPYGVAVDATNVYWVDFTSGTVSRCAIGGCGGQATVLATGQTNPSAIAVDSTAIYWVNDANPGAVMKLAK